MTTLTLVTLAIIVAGAFTRLNYARALALGGATPIGAALALGSLVVPTFYAVAIGAVVGIIVRTLQRARQDDRISLRPVPGGRTLIGFTAWAIVATLLASLLFAGVVVYYPSTTPSPLPYGVITISNIAQLSYLILSVAVVFFLARSRPDPTVLGLVVTVVTLLSFWRYLSVHIGLPFPEGVFDNSPNFKLIEMAPGGIQRFRGILSEPSGLAAISLVAIAYMASRATQVRGWHRVGVIIVLALAAFMASISTSATFVVALVVLAGFAGLTFLYRVVVKRRAISPLIIGVVLAGVGAAFWLVPLAIQLVSGVVSEKVGSLSYDQRSTVDNVSYNILGQTYGIGIGIGSHRPSSFVAALFSTTGIPGTVMFALTLLLVFRAALPFVAYRPVIWGLLALLTTKVIAGPDLADPSGLLWISIGLLAQAGVAASHPDRFGLSPQHGMELRRAAPVQRSTIRSGVMRPRNTSPNAVRLPRSR